MFGIDQRCKVDQFIAKKNFLAYGDLSKAEKESLSTSVRRITLSYQLEESKSHIPPYIDDLREYHLINIFTIEVSGDANLKRISTLVMGAIPYPTLIVFRAEAEMCLAACHQRTNQNDKTKNVLEELALSQWQPYDEGLWDITQMNLRNCYTLYSDMVDAIAVFNAKKFSEDATLTGDEARALTAKMERIQTELTALRAKLKQETQFNRKMELNIAIKRLEKERDSD